MELNGVADYRQRSQSKRRPQQAEAAVRIYSHSSRQFSAHTNLHSHAYITERRGPQGTHRYRYNQIDPLDHKMADNCVSLARTNTASSTITKLIKSWKTSNKS